MSPQPRQNNVAVCRICDEHIQLWAVAVCKLPSETKVELISTNIRPVAIDIIVRFLVRGLSQREMSKNY